MFYGQCWKCGERWELGTASTCNCEPDQPQRTWVGLEAEEVQELRYKIDVTAHWTYDDFAQAIEAKLKEKNT